MSHQDEIVARIDKRVAEFYEAAVLLKIAVNNASRQINRAFGAFLTLGVQFDSADQHNVEGGQADDRC